jgi:ParB-like chromosome segregation protein Spo0J
VKIIEFETEKLIPYARNPRKNDHAIDRMASTILEFGFRVPILVQSDGHVIDGHLRLKAAKKIALETVPAIVVDDLSPAQIKALRLNINRMAELADWDNDMLKVEIDELKAMDFDLDLLGFDKMPEFEPDLPDDDDSEKQKPFVIRITFADEEEAQELFAELAERGYAVKI